MLKTNKEMKNNEFYTYEKNVEPLVELLLERERGRELVIWCPADTENSAFVKVLKGAGFKVINSHIDEGKDYLTYEPEEHYDIIITNPPYSIRQEWIKRTVELGKPFIFLVPNTQIMLKQMKQLSDNLHFCFFNKRIYFFTETGEKVSPVDAIYIAYKALTRSHYLKTE